RGREDAGCRQSAHHVSGVGRRRSGNHEEWHGAHERADAAARRGRIVEAGDGLTLDIAMSQSPEATIRRAADADFESMWSIFRDVIASEDTYVFSPDTPRESAWA